MNVGVETEAKYRSDADRLTSEVRGRSVSTREKTLEEDLVCDAVRDTWWLEASYLTVLLED